MKRHSQNSITRPMRGASPRPRAGDLGIQLLFRLARVHPASAAAT